MIVRICSGAKRLILLLRIIKESLKSICPAHKAVLNIDHSLQSLGLARRFCCVLYRVGGGIPSTVVPLMTIYGRVAAIVVLFLQVEYPVV